MTDRPTATTQDPRYFVDEIGHYDSSNALLTSGPISYNTRDDSGTPTEIQDWDGTRSYGYDTNNRLASESSSSFWYDWVGNRLNPPTAPNPMEYNAADQLTRFPGEHQYDYLGTGSMENQYDDDSPRNLEKTFEYTPANLLSSVTHVGANYPTEMEWDADSNRVSFTSSDTDTTWYFVYDTTAGIPAVIEEETPSGSVYYIREPGGQLIARIGASTHYYHFDALGSTRLLTNGSGTVTDTYTYDAWGKLLDHDQETGSADQPYQYVGQLGYYSHYQDSNLFDDEYPTDPQFLQLGVRFYATLTGRFTQKDRMHEGTNSYSYVRNSPTMLLDPVGLQSLDPLLYFDQFGCFNLNRYMEDTCRAMWGAWKPDWWEHAWNGPDYAGVIVVIEPPFPGCPNAFNVAIDQYLECYVGVGYGNPPGLTGYAGYLVQCEEPTPQDLDSFLTGLVLSTSYQCPYGVGMGCDLPLMGSGYAVDFTVSYPGWSGALTCGWRAEDFWRTVFK